MKSTSYNAALNKAQHFEFHPISIHSPRLAALIVDDSSINRKILRNSVKDIFGMMEEACDGLDAVEQVKIRMSQHLSFDVILMDYMMPNMDGPTATQCIRALGYTGLIYGVTGNSLQIDIDYFRSKGANQVFIKPLNIKALENAISSTM